MKHENCYWYILYKNNNDWEIKWEIINEEIDEETECEQLPEELFEI